MTMIFLAVKPLIRKELDWRAQLAKAEKSRRTLNDGFVKSPSVRLRRGAFYETIGLVTFDKIILNKRRKEL